MEFEDLKLPQGTALQLQVTNSAGQPERFSCRFVGAVPGRSLIFSVPRSSGKLARFRPGQKMAVRLMVANGIGLFASVVEAQGTEPYPLLYVSYPESVTFKGIRSATRVAIDQPVEAENTSSLHGSQTSGIFADISITGARLELRDAIAEIGDQLTLSACVRIADIELDLVVAAVVRSRVERSTQEQNQQLPAIYGVEFTERNPEAVLVLYAYVFSQIVEEQTPGESA